MLCSSHTTSGTSRCTCAEEGFFGEPGTAAADLPNGFNHAETGFLGPEANQAVGEELYGDWGAETSEVFEAGYMGNTLNAQEQQEEMQEGGIGQAEGEQTYGGGYTHQQVVYKHHDTTLNLELSQDMLNGEAVTLQLYSACSSACSGSPWNIVFCLASALKPSNSENEWFSRDTRQKKMGTFPVRSIWEHNT